MNGIKKGHPDFIVYNKDDPTKKKYVEFKSQKDALSLDQIKWFGENRENKNYILFIED